MSARAMARAPGCRPIEGRDGEKSWCGKVRQDDAL